MSRNLFSNHTPRGIFDVAREIQMLTNSRQPPASEIRSLSPLHLPVVREPTQYFIDMGLRPALARRLLEVYMDSVSRYRQVFKSYFGRAIQGSSQLNSEHYRNIFVVQFKGTIQVLESQFMSAAWVWLCRAGLPPTLFWPRCIDVRVLYTTVLFTNLICPGLGTRGFGNESSDSLETWFQDNVVHNGCSWFQSYRVLDAPLTFN